jgi:Zn-dependent protease/CBS domain-containing protein
MRSWSLPAGRLFGVDLRVHLTFVVLLLFVWVTQSVALGTGGAVRGVALVVIIFACVVLHELGHALVARRSGVAVRSIILLPIGGVTLMEDLGARDANPARDIRIAVAGPLVNLLIAALSGAFILAFLPQAKLWSHPFVDAANLPRALFWSNVFLGAFNLLPAYPMDGGRILRAYLSERMEYVRATRIAVTVGQGFAMLLILLGMWNSWLMLIGVCLFFGAQLEDRSVVFQSVLESVRMEDVMLTGFSTLSPADTLEDALSKAVHTLQDDFPVVRGLDMVGVISKQRIVEALRRSGNGYVQSAMVRAFDIAQRNDSLASAFRKLGGRGLNNMIPVVDQQRLVGIVTMQNLMHSMALLAETRRLRRQQEAE